jgi:type I restriction enzyme R subunit
MPSYGVETSNPALALALRIDQTIKDVRPDSWRGNPAKENAIKAALFALLEDAEQVERVFLIVNAYGEY